MIFEPLPLAGCFRLVPEEERDRALERACGDDADLLAHLRALLAAGRRSSDLFDASVIADPKASLIAGQEIAGWQLERFLGAGGMGEVWLASRKDFGKRAAIKVVQRGLAGPEPATPPGLPSALEFGALEGTNFTERASNPAVLTTLVSYGVP